MIINTSDLDQIQIYKILIGSVLPRPIAWVSTKSSEGKLNLAPFSFFTVASSFPPVLCFSPALKEEIIDGHVHAVPKDTLRNIRDTKEFVVNIVSRDLAEKMNETSAAFPFGYSEFDEANLTPAPSKLVSPPRVGEALISMECSLNQIIEFGKTPGAGNLVLGDVVCFHLDESVYRSGSSHIDLEKLHPIGRLAGNAYCDVTSIFEMKRPT